MTDFGLFLMPDAASARNNDGRLQPPAVPSVAKVPMFKKLRRVSPSQKRAWRGMCPLTFNIWRSQPYPSRSFRRRGRAQPNLNNRLGNTNRVRKPSRNQEFERILAARFEPHATSMIGRLYLLLSGDEQKPSNVETRTDHVTETALRLRPHGACIIPVHLHDDRFAE